MNNPAPEKTFDPSAAGVNNGRYFGFPYTLEEAETVVYPVRWDVTTSYGDGAAKGPDVVLEASPQLDFYDFDYPRAWENRIGTHPGNALCTDNGSWREKALTIIRAQEQGEDTASYAPLLEEINQACRQVNACTRRDTGALLEQGKNVVLLGGDHSCPLGYLEALAERHSSFSILHLDAHADLREAYEGFTYSHASILYNALQLPAVERLVQVGVRDLCPDEVQRIECSGGRIRLWDDYTLHRNLFEGTKWAQVCSRIVNDLGENVYVSFDIDALDPSLCPGTGTPVPGGLSFHQASYLLRCLHESGRKVIGADLCEVSPGEAGGDWDANVGARVLYKLCSLLRACSEH